MKKSLSLLLVLPVLAAALMGSKCGVEYPQYSGVYKLIDFKYSRSDIAGKMPPEKIRITHRMSWDGVHWIHKMKIAAESKKSGEATGALTVDLDQLTKEGRECVAGRCEFDGTNFRSPKIPVDGPDQTDTWCTFYGYEYKLSAVRSLIVPSPDLLPLLYLSHKDKPGDGQYEGPEIGGQPTGQGAIGFKDAEEAKSAAIDPYFATEWDNQFSNNDGMSIQLTVSKLANINYDDCSKNGFPSSDRDGDTGTLDLTYKLEDGDQDYETDLRSAGTWEVDSPGSDNLFDNMTNFK